MIMPNKAMVLAAVSLAAASAQTTLAEKWTCWSRRRKANDTNFA